MRDLATGRGISTDKAAALRGDPAAIVEHRSDGERFKHLMAQLERLGVIEGEAVEVSAPELEKGD